VDPTARRKIIVKRVAARKIRETWRLKRERGDVSEKMVDDDTEEVGVDATLDALPDLL
jgi:hypothetical protein